MWGIGLNAVLNVSRVPSLSCYLGCSSTNSKFSALNVLAVRAYGESEFWLSGGKFILICILFFFTFITSLGANPKHDAYGFRYWSEPGAFAEYMSKGALGRFEGFLACLWTAAFTVVGPEYIAMVAAEARRPRIYIKAAFETVYWRFGIFFIGGLCMLWPVGNCLPCYFSARCN